MIDAGNNSAPGTSAQPLIVVVGETASGKSELALLLARQYNGEIICADSWTVYPGFDIGTAKPSRLDRAAARHHLLDIADPQQGFSAAVFKDYALAAITDVINRGRLPIMVGGTGLYVDSVLYNYSFLQQSNPTVRAALSAMTTADLLHEIKVRKLDTTGVDLHNKRRVIRLIENNGVRPTHEALRERTLILGVRIPASDLRWRVERRVDAMLAAGLETEVMELAARYGWDIEPMKGIGYREWQHYNSADQTYDEIRQKIIRSTMALAKRQRTWFKRNQRIQWVDDRSNIVEIVTTFLNK